MAFQFGRASALRSTNDLVDQLQEQNRQLREQRESERAQHRFNLTEKIKAIASKKSLQFASESAPLQPSGVSGRKRARLKPSLMGRHLNG
jgi:hypothetical protein